MNPRFNRTTATSREHLLALPGDEMIRHAADSLTHAITVRCNRRELWPWLIQMGADRAGWYSYDVLDNGGRHSAEQICRDFSTRLSAPCFRLCPDAATGFCYWKTSRATGWCLAGRAADGELIVTWAFMLHEIDDNTTRLIVRARASDDYRFHGLPKAMGLLLARMVHFIMERKQLLEIARRAERHATKGATYEHQASG